MPIRIGQGPGRARDFVILLVPPSFCTFCWFWRRPPGWPPRKQTLDRRPLPLHWTQRPRFPKPRPGKCFRPTKAERLLNRVCRAAGSRSRRVFVGGGSKDWRAVFPAEGRTDSRGNQVCWKIRRGADSGRSGIERRAHPLRPRTGGLHRNLSVSRGRAISLFAPDTGSELPGAGTLRCSRGRARPEETAEFLSSGRILPGGGPVRREGGSKIPDRQRVFCRHSRPAGGGFRYSRPVGPIRVDIGQNLNPVPGVKATQYFVSVGQAF
jgi:hypothetical protein